MNISFFLELIAVFIGSFLLTFLITPKIIGVVKFKRLMNDPNSRSSHIDQVPSLGGIAFYISIMLGLFLFQQYDENSISTAFSTGLMILFMMGLKDDLTVLTPITKFGAQILSICLILQHPTFHIHSFHGFLGIQEVSMYITLPLSAFIMLSIINSYNLIDGIDGLASIVGIIIFSVFGVLFFFLKEHFLLLICVLIIGSLMAFLRYNLSTDKKIFMGDTGSMIIGFVISVMTVEIFTISKHAIKELPFYIENLPLIVMAILVVPFFDTARVFTIRIMNRQNPFHPDRNHIHHILIDHLQLSHRKTSFLIGLVNVLFLVSFVFLSSTFDNLSLILVLLVIVIGMVYFFYRINFSYRNLRRRLLIRRKIKSILQKK